MNLILRRGGQLAGVLGIVLMVVAVFLRLSGKFLLAGFESGTLLQAGTAGLVVGCFAFLWLLVERTKT